MRITPRAIFGFFQSDLLFLNSSRHSLFLASLPSKTSRRGGSAVISWRKVDVVEQSRLPKALHRPKHTHTQQRHTDTLPTHPPGVLDLHPSRPSPEEVKERSKRIHPSSDHFSQSRLFPHVLPSGRIPHPDGSSWDLKGEKETRTTPPLPHPPCSQKKKSRIKRGCMMCCQEYMRVASSDIPIVHFVRYRQMPFLSECLLA